MTTRLPPRFYDRDALDVARDLVGVHLHYGPVTLRVTEVEAYRWPHDTANHCHRGPTERNAAMWGPPGRAYMYLCYGIHHMLNLVTGPSGDGAAVLIRAAEPVRGLSLIRERRGGREGPMLLNGPGKLTAALGLDLGFDQHPVTEPGGLEVTRGTPPQALAFGPRVGIDYAEPPHVLAPWRVADANSRWVSHRRRLNRSEP